MSIIHCPIFFEHGQLWLLTDSGWFDFDSQIVQTANPGKDLYKSSVVYSNLQLTTFTS